MLVKISIVIYFIAIILHFINAQMTLFWLGVMLLIVTTSLSIYMSYHQVSTQLKEHRDIIRKMEDDGASADEILEFMDQDIEVDESKLIKAPLWMDLVLKLGIVGSFILCVIGIMCFYYNIKAFL